MTAQGVAPRRTERLRPPATDDLPVLWHLKVSPYNEKARWALDFKRIAHRRIAAVPGKHAAIARRMAGGSTFPVLILDGRAIGDSTSIIRALEERHPDPALYPSDAVEWQRALELEDFFDEELGPYSRLLFLHHTLPDPNLMLGAFVPDLRGLRRAMAGLSFPLLRHRIKKRFQITPETAPHAYEKLAAAGARFRSEVQRSGYLVGDRFTVADLTLAALIAPLVAPAEFPYPQPQRAHPRLAPLRETLAREGLLDWTLEMYARHRGRSAEVMR